VPSPSSSPSAKARTSSLDQRGPGRRPAQPARLRRRERDLEAVTTGLTLAWNSGPVEGHVNRIKMLKRQMFGRAGLPLLRKRVLLSN
jgi:transposase